MICGAHAKCLDLSIVVFMLNEWDISSLRKESGDDCAAAWYSESSFRLNRQKKSNVVFRLDRRMNAKDLLDLMDRKYRGIFDAQSSHLSRYLINMPFLYKSSGKKGKSCFSRGLWVA